MVIISGGVSVGPHDHVKPALAELGVEEVFWSVALQPGKPTWFGRRDGTLVFGLPGNPVSAVVTFSLFVAPALAALQGRARSTRCSSPRPCWPPRSRATRDREQAVRVRLERQNGRPAAIAQRAAGLAHRDLAARRRRARVIPAGEGALEAGTAVALGAPGPLSLRQSARGGVRRMLAALTAVRGLAPPAPARDRPPRR